MTTTSNFPVSPHVVPGFANLARVALLVVAAAAWWHALSRGRGQAWAVGLTMFAVVGWAVIQRLVRRARERFVRHAPMPVYLRRKLLEAYPGLGNAEVSRVEAGLRQFFLAHLRARRFVGMPSQVVDALWHAFILDTRAYAAFCRQAFGGMLHHSPAETLGRSAKRNDGLRRTWYWCCKEEGINPRAPGSLPLLFALDGELGIPNGFRYVPDCRDIDRSAAAGTWCGTEFGDGSSSGSPGDADGYGGEAGSSSSSSDGGGSTSDGGSGDGGGCGGGGGD